MADETNAAGASETQAPSGTDATGTSMTATGTTAEGGADQGNGNSGSFKDQAQNFAKQAADKARSMGAEGKDRAADALEEVSRLMGNAANTVDEKLGEQYGKYARSAADGLAGFSQDLKNKEFDDLLEDAQNLVRKSPAVAIGVAAAFGFVVARLIKAGVEPTSSTSASGDTNPTSGA